MITTDHYVAEDDDGYTTYRDGDFWMRHYDYGATVMYHHCPQGSGSDVLLVDEIQDRRCNHCTKLKFPDDLWTLYVLLEGRGV